MCAKSASLYKSNVQVTQSLESFLSAKPASRLEIYVTRNSDQYPVIELKIILM